MRHFAYLGDHAATTLWGIQFPRGVAVAVSDPHAIRKLEGNSHFSEQRDGYSMRGDVIEHDAPQVQADAPQAGQADELAYLREEAKRLGLTPHHRAGINTLKAAIAAAKQG